MKQLFKLLLAISVTIAFGTAHADELDEITMGVLNESDIDMDDVAQTIKLPSLEQLKIQTRERIGEDEGQGELKRERHEAYDSELSDATQEMEQEQDELNNEKLTMEDEQNDLKGESNPNN